MSTLDVIMLIPIGIGAFNGYKKGLLIEIFGVAAFIAAIIIGFKFLYLGAGVVENVLGLEKLTWLSPYMSFFVVFVPALYLIRQLGFMMKKAIRITFLGTLDGIFGATLGAITATFGLSVFIWIVEKIGIPLPKDDSQLYGFIQSFAPRIIHIVSDLLPGGNWLEYLDSLKQKIVKS